MPLTHVCVWNDKNGYRRVTIEEATRMYPHGVSASLGIFICSLCAQNVGLTGPGENVRHFRHSSATEKKQCEDRSQVYLRNNVGYNSHPMPMRIKVNQDSFYLELGFFRLPISDSGRPQCARIKITGENSQSFNYSFDRISRDGITYLNVGKIPSSEYHLFYQNPSPNLNRYWPPHTLGVNPNGSFFDCSSGKMLHAGSKAYLDKDYFLLQKESLLSVRYDSISYKRITQVRLGSNKAWYLFKIHIKNFSPWVARFFLQRSVYLTEKPVEFYPIWPPYVESPCFLYYADPKMYFYMTGEDTELNIYPSITSTPYQELDEGKLYKISFKTQEQLFLLGQFGANAFFYVKRKKLNMKGNLPQVQIKTVDGNLLDQDIYYQLPKGKQISITTQFDGKSILFRKDYIQEIRRITAEKSFVVDNLSYGCEIQIYQSCDLVRTIQFKREKQNTDYTELDQRLVNRLRSCKRMMIPVSHNAGAWIKNLSQLPLSQQWLYKVLRGGEIPVDAMRVLKFFVHIRSKEQK